MLPTRKFRANINPKSEIIQNLKTAARYVASASSDKKVGRKKGVGKGRMLPRCRMMANLKYLITKSDALNMAALLISKSLTWVFICVYWMFFWSLGSFDDVCGHNLSSFGRL